HSNRGDGILARVRWVLSTSKSTHTVAHTMIVEDHGGGLDLTGHGALGEQPLPSENGLGVGLFLTNATIQRMGGILKARTSNRGTIMIIELPGHGAAEQETGDAW
ncbi:MAG: ATP-binding protein, partial [Pseudomonadota bacterium]|nr:ATP-binding protein [Pseudomonadota bacterium]